MGVGAIYGGAASMDLFGPRTLAAGRKQRDSAVGGGQEKDPSAKCETCENRKYKDGSNDPGVSFKTPGRIKPEASAAVVKSHENEHVGRNRAKAEREGREILSQTVTLKTSVCPECHRVYVSGGETRTMTAGRSEEAVQDMDRESGEQTGRYMDFYA